MAGVQLRVHRRRTGSRGIAMSVSDSTAMENVALVDLIDRVIGGGVVISGDIVISMADVDLIYLGLRLVLAPAHEVEATIGSLGRGTP